MASAKMDLLICTRVAEVILAAVLGIRWNEYGRGSSACLVSRPSSELIIMAGFEATLRHYVCFLAQSVERSSA